VTSLEENLKELSESNENLKKENAALKERVSCLEAEVIFQEKYKYYFYRIFFLIK
jgi:hypothetical protein